MKWLVSVLSLIFVISCTSKETKIREAAILEAKDQYEAEVRDEISKRVSGKKNLQTTAVHILTERAQFDVLKVQDQERSANAVVQVRTEPDKVTENLIEIMIKLEDQKEARFNVANAIKLIRQQLKVSEGAYSEKSYNIKLEDKGEWVAVREPQKTK